MNNKELDKMIDWCSRMLREEKSNVQSLRKEYFDGYEKAMLHTMVYLYSRKRYDEQ